MSEKTFRKGLLSGVVILVARVPLSLFIYRISSIGKNFRLILIPIFCLSLSWLTFEQKIRDSNIAKFSQHLRIILRSRRNGRFARGCGSAGKNRSLVRTCRELYTHVIKLFFVYVRVHTIMRFSFVIQERDKLECPVLLPAPNHRHDDIFVQSKFYEV